ncbi:hypothetical protein CerSpe_017990 [Prunus speciosa]
MAEWSSIKDSRIWDLPEEEDRIIPVLKLSYDNLTSPSLKQCFTYCSMLRKDVEIERDNLIQLWMAQGLLHPSPDKSKEMEDIGNEYFDILLQSSLFQDARTDEYGIISKCKMHDLVHDLAELVSKFETSTQDKYGHTLEVRHVALVSTSILESIRESSVGRLHSLFSDGKLPSNMLPGFKALRVLNLFKANIEELPISIGKLKHLRYLDISETRFKILPNSIGKLYNLQTLRATNCALEEFPKEVENLINLRHIYWDERTKFPLGILGKLSCLRTLPPFYVDNEMGREIEELAGLNQLNDRLIIYNMEHVRDRDEAGKAKLEEKKNLRHLIFVWTEDRPTTNNNEEDVLEGLQPHPKLESLMIKYFMGAKFPSWMTSRSLWLDNLKEIVLCGCNKCEEVPTLGHLPYLTVIWIDGMNNLKCVGADFYGYSNVSHVATSGTRKRALFPVLKEICIRNCNELIEWIEAPKEVMVFPCLEELDMNNCPKLRKAPSHFPFLKKLKIKGNDELTCLPEGILLKNGNNLISIEIRDCNKLTCIALDVFSCCASLGKLDVRNCRQLRHLPDGLDTLPLLERLTIKECPSLELIPIRHSGIAFLRELKIEHCEGLSGLPSVLEYCTSLQVLSIENCKNLTSIRLRTLASLRKLRIGCCPGLSGRLSGLEYCASLQELWIWDCINLTSIGITYDMSLTCLQELTIVSCDELSSLPALQQCPSLRKLHITNCPKVTSISSISVHDHDHDFECAAVAVAALSISHENLLQSTILSSLEHLSICDCPSLESIPDLHSFTSLRALVIIGCGRLQRLVSGLSTKMPISLVELSIHYCSDLQSIPDLQNFTSLRRLSIRDCKRLERLVCSGLQIPVSLVELCVVNCISLQSIPDLHIFASLHRLTIENCETLELLVSSELQMPVSLVELKIREAPNLETLPSLDNLTSLSTLEIYNCGKLKDLPTALHCSTSLKKLELGGFWDGLDSFPGFHVGTGSSQLETLILTGWPKLKSLPEQIQNFTSLTYLWIECFDGIEAFPEWLGNLTSLTKLEIWNFKNLMYLPSVNTMQRLTKLQTLQISGCPLLQQRCAKDSGPEWTKISQIPDIKGSFFFLKSNSF